MATSCIIIMDYGGCYGAIDDGTADNPRQLCHRHVHRLLWIPSIDMCVDMCIDMCIDKRGTADHLDYCGVPSAACACAHMHVYHARVPIR